MLRFFLTAGQDLDPSSRQYNGVRSQRDWKFDAATAPKFLKCAGGLPENRSFPCSPNLL